VTALCRCWGMSSGMHFPSLASAAGVQGPSEGRSLRSTIPKCVAARDGGMVIAETAVVLPVFVLILGLLLAVVGHSVDAIRAIDAARSAARLAARGEPLSVVRQQALDEAPAGSTVHVSSDGQEVRVHVVAPERALIGPLGLPAAETVAVALTEGGGQ